MDTSIRRACAQLSFSIAKTVFFIWLLADFIYPLRNYLFQKEINWFFGFLGVIFVFVILTLILASFIKSIIFCLITLIFVLREAKQHPEIIATIIEERVGREDNNVTKESNKEMV